MNDYGFEKRSTQVKKNCTVLAVLFVLAICAAIILCAQSGHTVLGYILFGVGGILEIICLSILLHYLSKYGLGDNEKGYSRLLHVFLIHCIFTLAALYCMHITTVRYTLFLAFADGALGAALVLFAAVFYPHANKSSRAWLSFVAGIVCALLSFFGQYAVLCWVFLILAVLLAVMTIASANKAMNLRRGLVISGVLLGLLLAAGSIIWLLNSGYSPKLHMAIHALMLLYGIIVALCVRCAVQNEYSAYIQANRGNEYLADASAQMNDGDSSAKTDAIPSKSTDQNDLTNGASAEDADSDVNAVSKAAAATTAATAAGAAAAVSTPKSNTQVNCNLALKPQFRDNSLHSLPDMPVSALNGISDEQVSVLEHMGASSIADLAALPCVKYAQQIAEMAKREE